MSDPVTNIEIEDVLSSIRRLVSEETSLKSRAEPARNRPHENRLVLTPALRVADEPAETPEGNSVSVGEMNQPDDTETPWSNPDTTLYSAAQVDADEVSSTGVVDEIHFNEAETSEEHTDDDEGIEHAETLDAEAVEDELHEQSEAVAAADREDMLQAVEQSEDQNDDGLSDDDHTQELHNDDAQESAEEKSKTAGFDNLIPLSAKIEALEMAIGETQDQWEPDGAAGDDYAGTPVQTLKWQDHDANSSNPDDFPANDQDPFKVTVVEIDPVQDQPASATPFSGEESFDDDEGGLDLLANDEGIIDEETLRALVADIVREELQGALGERITRNVRKLVRREIHRALTAQDLD